MAEHPSTVALGDDDRATRDAAVEILTAARDGLRAMTPEHDALWLLLDSTADYLSITVHTLGDLA